jgi:MFS family permease
MTSFRVQVGLNSLNFLVGAMLTAFGPFFSVYLTQQGWTQTDIGFALSVGTAAALIFQVPAGAMIDFIHHKRLAIACGLLLTGIGAGLVVAAPVPSTVVTSRVVQALGGALLTPAITALTLKFCGHAAFSERLGINGRYASLGNAFAAAMLGAVAYYLSEGTVFFVTELMLIPALVTLVIFRDSDTVPDDHPATLHPRERRARDHRPWDIFRDPVLHIFAACVVLFHLSNAAMLPLALNELSKRATETGFVVSAAIIVPQVVVAACGPWTGRLAENIGRKPILLFGFVALPLRALVFAMNPDAMPLVAAQVLDGVSAMVFGLAMPLIAADLTQRTGYLNLAIGSLSLAGGIGATASTTVAGWLADTFSARTAFIGLAVAGAAAVAMIWQLMPETRPGKPMTGKPAIVTA